MSQNFSLRYYEGRTFHILLLLIFGYISSHALISIATGLLLANFLFSWKEHRGRFVKMAAFPVLAASLIFIVSILSLPFAENFQDGLQQIWKKLPWLIIPFSLAALSELSRSYIDFFVTFLIAILCVSGVIVLINYFSNYHYYTEQIAIAKHIPAPMNHIRYSLMLAFGGVMSIFYAVRNSTKLTKYDQKFFVFTSLFFFALIHILAVRSGIVSYYFALFYLFLYFSFHFKKWWTLIIFFFIILLTPYFAYHNVGSFKNKVDYMCYDFEQLQKGNIGHNSDSRRFRALLIGWELIKEKPVLGQGLGNGENACFSYYQKYYPEVEEHNQKVPHNQFLFTMLELGILGFLSLLIVLALPLCVSLTFKNPEYLILWCIIVISCLAENTFESQLGASFYLVFASLTLKRRLND